MSKNTDIKKKSDIVELQCGWCGVVLHHKCKKLKHLVKKKYVVIK
jgi:transcription elongation factor Elf1